MVRMMTTGAMAFTLLATMPALAEAPIRLSDSSLDQVTAGGWLNDGISTFDVFFAIEVPELPALDDPDDDIWDLMGSGVVSQSALLQNLRGRLELFLALWNR